MCVLLSTSVQAVAVAQVSVTAIPATISAGGTSTVQVIVSTLAGPTSDTGGSPSIPLRNAQVTLSTSSPGITFSPSSGKTDNRGRFTSTLISASSASGIIPMLAVARIPGDFYGEGSGTVTVQQSSPVPEPPPVIIIPAANQPPVAVIQVDHYAGIAPLTVQFDGGQSFSSTGAVLTYTWDFGDGTTGDGYVAAHTYTNTGSYTALLTVTDNAGLQSASNSVIITAGQSAAASRAEAVIVVNQSFGPAPLAVVFYGTKSSDPAGSIQDWQWDFGDGSSAHGPVTTHIYPNPGSYSSTLEVTGANGLRSDFSTIQIIVQSSLAAPTPTPALLLSPKPTSVVSQNHSMTGTPLVPENNSSAGFLPWPASRFIPPSFAPLAGIATGIILGAAASIVTRSKPSDPAGRKFQEFMKNVLGKKGSTLIAAWEKKKLKTALVRRQDFFAGLSLYEIAVAAVSALLIGTSFYLLPDAGPLLTTIALFSGIAGTAVVASDLVRRWMVRRHGQYAEYRIWPLGTVLMYLTAWQFGCACGKPSRFIIEGPKERDRRDVALECLAGPAVCCVFAGIFALLILRGGDLAGIGVTGLSVNIMLALYSLMPFEPMDGPKVWRWNRGIFLALFIPLLVLYIGIAYWPH